MNKAKSQINVKSEVTKNNSVFKPASYVKQGLSEETIL